MRFENYEMQIHKIISNTLLYKIQNEKLKTITISDIIVNPDRQGVTVYVNSDNKNKSAKQLNSIKGVFRNQIAKNIQSKHTPHINFQPDNLPEQIQSIENTLKNIEKNKVKNSFAINNYKKDV